MINILVTLLVYLVVLGLLWTAFSRVPFLVPFKWAVDILFLVICALLILGLLTGSGHLPMIHI